ncbi:MAG: hypothetical protein D6682_08365 [Zetaproteobacteria bacterium]|nr:MAG: hypothetical protein D6682_08365 [Zetaproteobacteria bacterium]
MPTVPLAERAVTADGADFAGVHHTGGSLRDFLCSLPALGAAQDLLRLRDAVNRALRDGRIVLLACGGRLLERGLSPVVAHAIACKRLRALALTGSAMVRDVEVALAGSILGEGRGGGGVGAESCALIKEAIDWAAAEGIGLGAAVGRKLIDGDAPHRERSILASAVDAGLPVTVHPAIGADAYNRFPHLNGEAFGAAAVHDFRRFADIVAASAHGVWLNVASSVVMPRLLLEAMHAARSVGMAPESVTACVLGGSQFADAGGVVAQAVEGRGRSCTIAGAIELLFPLLMAAVGEG